MAGFTGFRACRGVDQAENRRKGVQTPLKSGYTVVPEELMLEWLLICLGVTALFAFYDLFFAERKYRRWGKASKKWRNSR